MEIDKSKLRVGGQMLTQKLFLETNGWDRSSALYTLTDEDKWDGNRPIYSIRRLYVDLEDVHEYEFAVKYFGSWQHWQKVANSPRLKDFVNEWREELSVKLRTRNLKRMEELAADGDRQAIKYMADKGWEGKDDAPKKRGRPSKEEKQGYLKQQAEEDLRLADDFARISGELQ